MASQRLVIPELARVFEGESISGLSEWQLLERYLERRDEAAFEALVTRHGPMVLGVCRRVLGFTPDAEDAFQATFLILVRRARDLGPRDAIGPWLYGVASRVSVRARAQAARRRRREAVATGISVADPREGPLDPDLVEILDQELGRLPGKYRSPLVLCYLEGRTHEEAARDLHWPVGTVKGRLARARELLRSRLARRGFAPSSGAILAVSSPDLRGLLDRPLVDRTVGASARLAAGHSVAQVGSQSITSLVEGVLAAMFLSKIKWAAAVAMATGFAFTSAAVMGRQAATDRGVPPAPKAGRADSGLVKNLAPGQAPSAPPKAGRAGSGETPIVPEPGRSDDPRSLKIIATLEEPISMSFANETPLDDVLKYIKQATTTPTFNGIPIYVDPVGLQEAERSLMSTIQIDLEGVPLRRTLQLALAQLGLIYFVQDGILVITNEGSENRLPPSMREPSPIATELEKAERGELTSAEMKELIERMKLRRQVLLMSRAHETPYGGEGGPGGGGFGAGADQNVFPGEENVNATRELLKEIHELVHLLKAEKEARKPAEAGEPHAPQKKGATTDSERRARKSNNPE